jgi:mannose-6-phosphate isomerase-like protein (cupin superfamily)
VPRQRSRVALGNAAPRRSHSRAYSHPRGPCARCFAPYHRELRQHRSLAREASRAPPRPLLILSRGSFAHFQLPPGATSFAVTHRTVEETWFILGGRGEMWRKQGDREEVVTLDAGVCLTIPLGTHFNSARSAMSRSRPWWLRCRRGPGMMRHAAYRGNGPLRSVEPVRL